MSRKVNATYTADQVKSAFKVFEGSAPAGYVRADALIKYITVSLLARFVVRYSFTCHRHLCTYGTEKLSLEQAQDLVAQLEVDATGLINYVEYVNMMMSTS